MSRPCLAQLPRHLRLLSPPNQPTPSIITNQLIPFFWYGWTVDKDVFWIVPILGLLPFGFGVMGIMAGVQTYFIDSGGMYAASAMAGLTVIRCLFAAFLPLVGPPMYTKLGLG